MSEFAYMIRPQRDPDAEADLVTRHFAYLEQLRERGIVRYAGRCEDRAFGIVLFEAPDEAAAETIVREDPAVADGLFSADLHAWRTALS